MTLSGTSRSCARHSATTSAGIRGRPFLTRSGFDHIYYVIYELRHLGPGLYLSLRPFHGLNCSSHRIFLT